MSSECVKVMVRARPINQREINEGNKMCIEIDKKVNQVIIRKGGSGEEKAFTYDAVYDWNSNQRAVYDESAFPLVESVLEGYNGTIFAYGQTGCGKTHTMMGVKDGNPDHRGIIPNAFEHIYGFIDDCPNNNSTMKFLVRCSYLEIYNEDIRDLLSSKQNIDHKLELKEDPNRGGVYVKDLTCCIVKSIPEIEKLMNYGTSQRKVGETAMNKDSSRSHSIFTIYIETQETDANGESRIKAGKLNLVDLAGSERQSKTQAQGIRLKEATKINLSLSALGNVISALVDGRASHIPYRDSKLTRLLQDSLGGNTKTVMIAAISPSDFNYEESLSTLRYAARAKSIQNKPRVNEDPKDALLKQYEEEILKLKKMLEQNNGASMINLQQAQLVRRQTHEHIVTATNMEEESVDQLLEKLAKKGKKIKIINEAEEAHGEDQAESPQFNPNRKGIKQARSINQDPHSIKEAIDEDDDTGGHSHHGHTDSTSLPPTFKRVNHKRTIFRESSDSQIPPTGPVAPMNLKDALNDASLTNDQLQLMIKEMEQRLVVGGNALGGEQNAEEKERLRQQRALQIKLRNERKKQKQLMEDKLKKEEQLLLQQQQYSSLQEEVEQNRKIIEKLRSKYTQIDKELRDVREEAEEHKEGMLDTIREQEREIEFLNLVTRALLKDFELQNLREKSRYDEFNQRWVLPVFYVKERAIQLPKVGIRNADSLISQELDKRDFIIQGSEQQSDYERQGSFGQAQGGASQKSQRNGMNETYYNGNTGGFGAKKTGQGFMRTNHNAQSGLDVMRQSRMSIGPEQQSVEAQRATPLEFKRGANTGPRAGIKYKQNGRIIIDAQQQEYNQFSSLSNHINNGDGDTIMNKKNNKSNVLLQPLNYKSTMPTNNAQNVAQGIEEILKNHQITYNNSSQDNIPQSYYGQSSIPIKKNGLGKLPQNNPGQIQLNLNPSDSSNTMNGPNGAFQMSIQATLSIEPSQFVAAQQQRRGPQLAPIQPLGQSPPQHKTVGMEQPSGVSQVRLNGPLGGGQVNRKNRVYISGQQPNDQ